MRVLLLPSSYPPVLGGLQTVTHRLAWELRARGHMVWVMTNRYPRHLPRREALDGVPVERVLFLYPRLAQLRAGRPDVFLAGWLYFPPALGQLLWRIRWFRPDVVNLHFAGEISFFVLIAARLFPFRLVVSLHGDDVEGLERRTKFDRWLFRAILRQADAVTACSHYLMQRAITVEPTAATKGVVIPNGVDLHLFTNDRHTLPVEGRYLLAAGRFVPKKGFDTLLQAFAHLASEFTDVRLVLLGDGPERGSLERLATTLGLNGRVLFPGQVEHQQVATWIRDSCAVVVPSRLEPFGLSALEALALGKPVVATSAGGLPEVLDGAEACLVPPGDEEALAEALRRTLQAVVANPAYGQHNRELAARFSWDQLTEAYLRVYQGEEG
jgi:glycogen(starch) synthase